MEEFEGEELVELHRMVGGAPDMASDHGLKGGSVEIGTAAGTRVQQDVLNVMGELVAVPGAKVAELLPAKE